MSYLRLSCLVESLLILIFFPLSLYLQLSADRSLLDLFDSLLSFTLGLLPGPVTIHANILEISFPTWRTETLVPCPIHNQSKFIKFPYCAFLLQSVCHAAIWQACFTYFSDHVVPVVFSTHTPALESTFLSESEGELAWLWLTIRCCSPSVNLFLATFFYLPHLINLYHKRSQL